MEVITEDTKLDDELQEMYIVSSHWNMDISFLKDEIRFLKSTLSKYRIAIKSAQVNRFMYFNKALEMQEVCISAATQKITEFLRSIAPFVTGQKKQLGLDMLENFIALETEIKVSTENLSKIRHSLFSFLEEVASAKNHRDIYLSAKKTLPLKFQL